MPGNSWQDLQRRSALPKRPAGELPARSPLPRSPAASPRLEALLEQRNNLESNLQGLVSGQDLNADPREAARFQIPTFAQRRAQQAQWERSREQQQERFLLQRSQERREQTIPNNNADNVSEARTGLRDFQQGSSAASWLSSRDQSRRQIRDGARDRLNSFDQATRPLRQVGRQLHQAGSQLRDLDRKLASEGLNDERNELNKLGADKLQKADKTLQKVTKVLDAPQRAVKKIDDFWQKKDQQISGAMDRFSAYAERSQNRLNVERGGSGDLFERMQRNRDRALKQRQELRQQEQKDEARKQRAQNRKKEKEKEGV